MCNIIGIKRLCMPKAKLNSKNSTRQPPRNRLVEFLLFNSIHVENYSAYEKTQCVIDLNTKKVNQTASDRPPC